MGCEYSSIFGNISSFRPKHEKMANRSLFHINRINLSSSLPFPSLLTDNYQTQRRREKEVQIDNKKQQTRIIIRILKICCDLPSNRYRLSCCTPRKCWQRHSRSTWCSRDDRHVLHNVVPSGFHRTASNKSVPNASPCPLLSYIRHWKLTTSNTNTKQNKTNINKIFLWQNMLCYFIIDRNCFKLALAKNY